VSKSKFMALAEAAGIEVEYCAGGKHRRTGETVPYELMLDAPDGKWFAGSFTSCDGSLNGQSGETSPDWAELCKALQSIISAGFVDADEDG